ncbi:hypothetical protein BU17DRAFT_101935 [Hysterangium stoloniferum]|nr:hypothetical protein BU17DRAFT_101935 [Hysterangium stoloniferum]
MPNIHRQRSPRETQYAHPVQTASRLHKSASVPGLSIRYPSRPSPTVAPTSTFPSQPSFLLRSGVKHHAFPSTATYPLSYHKKALASDSLDHFTLKSFHQSCSAIDFTFRSPPTRCLDLGCGTGAWILEAANEWPECHFIGFDLVDIQLPSHLFPPALSRRIKWMHGSFLSTLPFGNDFSCLHLKKPSVLTYASLISEDEFFDHIHIRHIARGIPEDKWDSVIAEIARVLKVGGSVEIFEEDIIFPVLPRSCTAMPHQRIQKLPTHPRPVQPHIDGATTNYDPREALPEHDHLVLEKLFYRVFERRFINLKPTALIMGTLNIHMRQVLGTPVINFPFPPAPFPEDPPGSVIEANTSMRSTTPKVADQRPTILIPSPLSPTSSPEGDEDGPVSSTASSSWSSPLFSDMSSSGTSAAESIEDLPDGSIAFFSDTELTNVSSKRQKCVEILPEERLRVTAGTLGLNLYRSWQGVMACREAMWDEFQLALEARDPLLDLLQWEHKSSNREKFDSLMERYQLDMEARYPISNALVSDLNWKAPKRSLTLDEKKTLRMVAEVRRDVLRLEKSNVLEVPEGSHICRKARMFVARKGAVFGTES